MKFSAYLDFLESSPSKRAVVGPYGSLYPDDYASTYRIQYGRRNKVNRRLNKKIEDDKIRFPSKLKRIVPNYDKPYLHAVEDETIFNVPKVNDTKWTAADSEEVVSTNSV